jgi:hypothetical protein
MKVKVKKVFRLQISPTQVRVFEPGIYDVDQEIASKILRFGNAEIIRAVKKAPENKVVEAPETKESDSGSAGSKPRKRGRPGKQQ